MADRRPLTGRGLLVPAALVAWTLFVWGGRLRNLAQEPGPIGETSRWSLVGSIAFCLLAALVVVAPTVERSRAGRRGLVRPAVGALGALTIVVWVIRGLDIALGDHSLGFIVVHLILAVVSIGLAVAAWRVVRLDALADAGEGDRVEVGYPRSDG